MEFTKISLIGKWFGEWDTAICFRSELVQSENGDNNRDCLRTIMKDKALAYLAGLFQEIMEKCNKFRKEQEE